MPLETEKGLFLFRFVSYFLRCFIFFSSNRFLEYSVFRLRRTPGILLEKALVFVTGITNGSNFGNFFLYFDNQGPHRLREQTAFSLISEKRY